MYKVRVGYTDKDGNPIRPSPDHAVEITFNEICSFHEVSDDLVKLFINQVLRDTGNKPLSDDINFWWAPTDM